MSFYTSKILKNGRNVEKKRTVLGEMHIGRYFKPKLLLLFRNVSHPSEKIRHVGTVRNYSIGDEVRFKKNE